MRRMKKKMGKMEKQWMVSVRWIVRWGMTMIVVEVGIVDKSTFLLLSLGILKTKREHKAGESY